MSDTGGGRAEPHTMFSPVASNQSSLLLTSSAETASSQLPGVPAMPATLASSSRAGQPAAGGRCIDLSSEVGSVVSSGSSTAHLLLAKKILEEKKKISELTLQQLQIDQQGMVSSGDSQRSRGSRRETGRELPETEMDDGVLSERNLKRPEEVAARNLRSRHPV